MKKTRLISAILRKFMTSFKTGFKRRFADFRKIQNVVQLLNSSFTLLTKSEWINETVKVFKCNKAFLQMEIIEFQTDEILKNVYNENYSKTGFLLIPFMMNRS